MKVELKELGPNNDPYLILTAQGVLDAVAIGSLVEKCASRGISYSSNTSVLADGDFPYLSLQLAYALSGPLAEEVRALPEKFKKEQEKKDGKTT